MIPQSTATTRTNRHDQEAVTMSTPVVTGVIRPFLSYFNPEDLEITDLPFVTNHGKGKKATRSFWDVKPNGNYLDECLIGEAYALEALQYMMAKKLPSLVTWAVLDMPREENRSGIEIGFISTIAEYAIVGATQLARGRNR